MRCDKRNIFLGDLMSLKLGTKEVESFISKQERLRRDGISGGLGDNDSTDIAEKDKIMVV